MSQYARPATLDDVRHVAEHMRPLDVEEARAFGLSPLQALEIGLHQSDVCLALIAPDGTPCAITGISPNERYRNWGAIWLLGTSQIEDVPMTFLRHSKQVLKEMADSTPYEAFFNYTYAPNTLHHKWIKWCGFTFLRKVELPPFNKSFYEFISLRG